ncbi:hypothetical protein NB22_05130 [Limosilactobacillus fermentum NB-22]|uniref:Uncharacterized protein n=1 Tax=Limosilactobacillus fermentum NB-22 TaxID=1408443 RepID=A0A829M125_LIMFE|nr:hypothetical protein NB22_05130 [Limosilactobacillus fermentum NB-22]
MGISINVIFLLASLIVFWIIPAIGIAKNYRNNFSNNVPVFLRLLYKTK